MILAIALVAGGTFFASGEAVEVGGFGSRPCGPAVGEDGRVETRVGTAVDTRPGGWPSLETEASSPSETGAGLAGLDGTALADTKGGCAAGVAAAGWEIAVREAGAYTGVP